MRQEVYSKGKEMHNEMMSHHSPVIMAFMAMACDISVFSDVLFIISKTK